jgi:hypothetical protein
MRKQCLRIVIAVTGVAGLCMAARGSQVSDQIQVNIPYEFVVAGKTLPAGTYRVSRLGDTDEETSSPQRLRESCEGNVPFDHSRKHSGRQTRS